ncbi:lipase chaperone [gamma proteobacterium HdN1]|nr:lipase chaperone [gamma proteobacterium HdN1]
MRIKTIFFCLIATIPVLAFVLHSTHHSRTNRDLSAHQPTLPNASAPPSTAYTHAPPSSRKTKEAANQPLLNAAGVRAELHKTSLAETDIPPLPLVDSNGNLPPQRALRDLFDYFLALDGESDPSTIQNLTQSWVVANLPEHAAAQAIQMLNDYQNLNERLKTVAENFQGDRLEDKLQQIADTRKEVLGEDAANAFFGEDEAYDRYSLAQLEERRTHSGAVPAEDQELLLANLPPELQTRQRERIQQQSLIETTQRMEKNGASGAAIYQYQMLHGTPEVADRYQALTERRNAWNGKLDHYIQQRDEITKQAFSDEEKQRRIEQLRVTSFTPTEQLRVNALEAMEKR